MRIRQQPHLSRTSTEVALAAVSVRVAGHTILDDITLRLAQGTITGILGPNGAGKTTLLALITGLRQASVGTIQVMGASLPAQITAVRRRIGVVLQETALYDDLTTQENLRFAASLYHLPQPQARIREVLALLGLSDRAGDLVRTLSGGLRRRVTLARALLHEPDLLVIDEPTLGVDVETRHAIWSHLRLLRVQGTTVVVATNYLDEALALCDQVAVLRQGKLLAYETPQALVARAGTCLDVACAPAVAATLAASVAVLPDTVHVETTATGITIFLRGAAVPDAIMRHVVAVAPITGVSIRAADLAEIFRAFDVVPA